MIVEVAQVKVAVVKENARGERRVALVPDSIHRLAQIGLDLLVEQGVAAGAFARFFPLLITAAGTARPAEVLVLGAGVAGLQAIGTARRLGAVVSGYDVRPAAKAEVESLGATFLTVGAVADGGAAGGYARALTDAEQRAQQDELNAHIVRHDVVITTAQVPGRRPPLLVTARAIKDIRPGSVIVDLGSGPLGGNAALSAPEASLVTHHRVTIIRAGHPPA